MREFKTILITGGSGFIGSHFIRDILKLGTYKNSKIINIDALTYAGDNKRLDDIKDDPRYSFHQIDIAKKEEVDSIFNQYEIDCVIHFAAESHVDKSISSPGEFIQTNIVGTFNLLQASLQRNNNNKEIHFHHVSTDEVYGSLGENGLFTEETSYSPRSPYSASKASSDHLVKSFHHTYGLSMTMSNCSNNYGPWQLPEKLIPVVISKIVKGESIPVYGKGENIRDWLHVKDHNSALLRIVQRGALGETYNIGGDCELKNIDLVKIICKKMSIVLDKNEEEFIGLIKFVKDRAGHDFRYAVDCSKLKTQLGWKQKYNFDQGIQDTIDWYIDNIQWSFGIEQGSLKEWMEINYQNR